MTELEMKVVREKTTIPMSLVMKEREGSRAPQCEAPFPTHEGRGAILCLRSRGHEPPHRGEKVQWSEAAAPEPEVEILAPARPPFKTAGGKRLMVETLLKYVPNIFGSYHEPFVGAGALFLGVKEKMGGRVKQYHLGDANPLIAAVYEALQTDVSGLVRRLGRMPFEPDFFEKQRAIHPDAVLRRGPVAAAAWFIYLNKTAFNGLSRYNRKGFFNVPIGTFKTGPTICDEENLRACARALGPPGLVEIRAEDFRRVLTRARRGDVVYMDSPYAPRSKTSDFTSYTKDGFAKKDHEQLSEVARDLKKRGVVVILTNSDTPFVRELYERDFKLVPVLARRSINSKGDGRGPQQDLIILG